jgi:lipoprotein-anchoring transpeptidase ErfK/SrfK
MVIAADGLILSASHGEAQLRQADVGDDDSVELNPEFSKTAVLYSTNEAPGTIVVQTAERHLYLSRATAARCAMASASTAKASSGRGS